MLRCTFQGPEGCISGLTGFLCRHSASKLFEYLDPARGKFIESIFVDKGGTSHLSYSLNSLKGLIRGIIQRSTMGATKGDTRSLDDSSFYFCLLGQENPKACGPELDGPRELSISPLKTPTN